MEEIICKLQKLSVTNQNQQYSSFDESIINVERQQFDEFLESCIELCQLISQADNNNQRIEQNLDAMTILIDQQTQMLVYNLLNVNQRMANNKVNRGAALRNSTMKMDASNSLGEQSMMLTGSMMSTRPADLDSEKQIVEITEERIALNTVCKLQRWARDNEVLINFTQLLSHFEDSQSPGMISQPNLLEGLIQLGF